MNALDTRKNLAFYSGLDARRLLMGVSNALPPRRCIHRNPCEVCGAAGSCEKAQVHSCRAPRLPNIQFLLLLGRGAKVFECSRGHRPPVPDMCSSVARWFSAASAALA